MNSPGGLTRTFASENVSARFKASFSPIVFEISYCLVTDAKTLNRHSHGGRRRDPTYSMAHFAGKGVASGEETQIPMTTPLAKAS
jgi:hypothetical protein